MTCREAKLTHRTLVLAALAATATLALPAEAWHAYTYDIPYLGASPGVVWSGTQIATACVTPFPPGAVCFMGIGQWDSVVISATSAGVGPVAFAWHVHGWWGDDYAFRVGGTSCAPYLLNIWEASGETLIVHVLDALQSSAACGTASSGGTAGKVTLAFQH